MAKKTLFIIPPALLEQVDAIAKFEHRTRSDLVRESLRRYVDNFKRTQGPRLTIVQREEEVVQDVIFDGIAQAKKTKEFEDAQVIEEPPVVSRVHGECVTYWEEAGEVVTKKLEYV